MRSCVLTVAAELIPAIMLSCAALAGLLGGGWLDADEPPPPLPPLLRYPCSNRKAGGNYFSGARTEKHANIIGAIKRMA